MALEPFSRDGIGLLLEAAQQLDVSSEQPADPARRQSQIMDPKMDSGYIPAGDTFEPAFDVCAGRDPAEVLWIMDEIFRIEMSFHEGYPLSQNLFTSLHIFRLISPDNRHPHYFNINGPFEMAPEATAKQHLVHILLRAYCIAVIKCVQLTLFTIQSQTFYEEEDFVTFLFGRELLPKLESQEAQKLLVDAMDWLDASNLDPEMQHALKHRLVMREHILYALDGDLEMWDKIQLGIDGLTRHRKLSEPLPEAFSDKVQRQLATSTPPRPMPYLAWQEACEKWTRLCEDIIAARSLTSTGIQQSPHCLQRAMWAFAYRDPAPGAYARAKMQDILTADDSVAEELPHFDLMLADIRDLVLAGDPLADRASFQVEVLTDIRHQLCRVLEECMSKLFGEYLNLYRMLCQNRCRMRRTFTQAVPILDQLEVDARATDKELHEMCATRRVQEVGASQVSTPITFWIRSHKLQIMEWVVQLGFETDLYLPDELANMYAVLNTIADSRRELLRDIDQSVRSRVASLRSTGNREYLVQAETSAKWLKSLVAQSSVTLAVGNAMCDLYSLLEQLRIVKTSPKPYQDEQLRYEARMKPLLGLLFDDIADLSTLNKRKSLQAKSVAQVCSRIGTWIKTARAHLNELKTMSATQAKYVGTEERWRLEIKSLEKVCVATSVASAQLEGTCKKHGKLDARVGDDLGHLIEMTIPPPGKRYHDWWAVPQLKEKRP